MYTLDRQLFLFFTAAHIVSYAVLDHHWRWLTGCNAISPLVPINGPCPGAHAADMGNAVQDPASARNNVACPVQKGKFWEEMRPGWILPPTILQSGKHLIDRF